MPSRRTFMQHSIAAATVAAALPVRAALFDRAAGPRGATHEPAWVVYDDASSAGPAFAAAAASRGARVAAVGGDLGRVWMRVLEPRLRRGPVALAGLTAGAPLFCLEYLARGYGLGLAYRIEHAAAGPGRYRHTPTGGAELAPRVAELERAGRGWGGAAGALAAGCPASVCADASVELLDLAAAPRGDGAVFSWLLVPKRSRAARPAARPGTAGAAPIPR